MYIPIIIFDKGILWDLLQVKSTEDIDYIFNQYSEEIQCMARNLIPGINKEMSNREAALIETTIITVKVHLLVITINFLTETLKVNSIQSCELTSLLLEKTNSLLAIIEKIPKK